jgi:hypothetical protein
VILLQALSPADGEIPVTRAVPAAGRRQHDHPERVKARSHAGQAATDPEHKPPARFGTSTAVGSKLLSNVAVSEAITVGDPTTFL